MSRICLTGFFALCSVTWRGGNTLKTLLKHQPDTSRASQGKRTSPHRCPCRARSNLFFSNIVPAAGMSFVPSKQNPPKTIENPLFETPKHAKVNALPRQPWRRARLLLLLLLVLVLVILVLSPVLLILLVLRKATQPGRRTS